MFKTLLSFVYLFRSFYFTKRNMASRARIEFEKASERMPKQLDFMDAYDARILLMEGRHAEAGKKLRLALAARQNRQDDNAHYIRLWCNYNIALYQADAEALAFKSQAGDINPAKTLRNFLPFFSDEAINRIIRASKAEITNEPLDRIGDASSIDANGLRSKLN